MSFDDRAALGLLASLAVTTGGRGSYAALKEGLREGIARDPFDANLVVVGGGAFLFYLAEREANPKVKTYWDALVFISTCMSVGYADVFARTAAGKAIASAVMTVGPALSGALLEAPTSREPTQTENAQLLAVQRIVVEKLEAILGELKAGRRQP